MVWMIPFALATKTWKAIKPDLYRTFGISGFPLNSKRETQKPFFNPAFLFRRAEKNSSDVSSPEPSRSSPTYVSRVQLG